MTGAALRRRLLMALVRDGWPVVSCSVSTPWRQRDPAAEDADGTEDHNGEGPELIQLFQSPLFAIPGLTNGHLLKFPVTPSDEDHQDERQQGDHIGDHIHLIQKGEIGKIGKFVPVGLLEEHQGQQHGDGNSCAGVLFICTDFEHQQHHGHHHQQGQHQPPERRPGRCAEGDIEDDQAVVIGAAAQSEIGGVVVPVLGNRPASVQPADDSCEQPHSTVLNVGFKAEMGIVEGTIDILHFKDQWQTHGHKRKVPEAGFVDVEAADVAEQLVVRLVFVLHRC